MTLWLAYHGRSPTKTRLCRFGLTDSNICCFGPHEETIDHLYYGCVETKSIWRKILDWIQITHDPKEWHDELYQIVICSKGKGWRASILKLAVTETIYVIWGYQNNKYFDDNVDNIKIIDNIIDMIVYRG